MSNAKFHVGARVYYLGPRTGEIIKATVLGTDSLLRGRIRIKDDSGKRGHVHHSSISPLAPGE